MFLVEAKGKSGIWNNTLSDDFIQFLPSNLKCSPQDLSIHYIPEEVWQSYASFQQSGGTVVFGQGKLQKYVKTIVPPLNEELPPTEVVELVEEAVLKPLISSWPYEEVAGSLVFQGNQVEE